MDALVEEYIATTNQLRPYVMFHAKLPFEKRKATILQFIALKYLDSHPDATLTDLVNRIRFSMSSATQLINRFVKEGVVTKLYDKKDKRVIRLKLTAKGKEKLLTHMNEKKKRMKKILVHVPIEDLKELVRINKSLLDSLKKDKNI